MIIWPLSSDCNRGDRYTSECNLFCQAGQLQGGGDISTKGGKRCRKEVTVGPGKGNTKDIRKAGGVSLRNKLSQCCNHPEGIEYILVLQARYGTKHSHSHLFLPIIYETNAITCALQNGTLR